MFAALSKERPDGLYVPGGPLVATNRKRIVDFAAKSRLPSVYNSREFIDAGGLMYYGVDPAESYRRVAYYVDRILKGTKPADLPVEQPTKFELVINLKTAKQIGLTIPPEVAGPGYQNHSVNKAHVQASDVTIGSRRKIDEAEKLVAVSMRLSLHSARATDAQQTGKIVRIGFVDSSTASGMAVLVNAFRQELSKLGWIEGNNITIEYRFAEQKNERLPELAAEAYSSEGRRDRYGWLPGNAFH